MPEVPNAPVGKKDKLSVYDVCYRTNVVVIFWMLASRNTPWYLTALRRSMDEICAGSLEASDQSNPSRLTGAMFFWSLSADSYSLRTKSFRIGKLCQKKPSDKRKGQTCTTSAGGIVSVQRSVHTAFRPNKYDVFGAAHSRPKFLIESALNEVINIEKHLQPLALETDFCEHILFSDVGI